MMPQPTDDDMDLIDDLIDEAHGDTSPLEATPDQVNLRLMSDVYIQRGVIDGLREEKRRLVEKVGQMSLECDRIDRDKRWWVIISWGLGIVLVAALITIARSF